MNIAQAKQQVKDTIEAYLSIDETGAYRISQSQQRPIFLLGAPGIGKTAIMAQIADELDMGLVSYSMTHHTRQSALGLPRIVQQEFEGLTYDSTVYTMSEIIASIYEHMTRTGRRSGILFLDEINCVSETLYPSMLQFLQFKTFGKHRVPDNWVVVCAGNPPEYNKSVHDFDIVTLDRLRKIDIEPDYQAWRQHAIDKGVHPAVLSFLEVKKECFYSVQSTPEGKRFVTARGWDDLSEIISLFEDTGKKVDRNLICQFIQDDEIAEKFGIYYDLFNKYRSDYQIEEILAGQIGDDISGRAKRAEFDEKIALINLLIDSISTDCTKALVAHESVKALRDVLREAKDDLLAGGDYEKLLEDLIARFEREHSLKAELSAKSKETKALAETVAALKGFKAQCIVSEVPAGQKAFDCIRFEYREHVSKLEQLTNAASAKIDNAFAFIDQVLPGGKENMVFITEMTARQATSSFISAFGSESYYAHNDDMMVDERRGELVAKIAELNVGNEGADVIASADGNDVSIEALREYYSDAKFEYGFSSLCKMTLPTGLFGMDVVDIGCRRGKGVFKISSMVRESGSVVGIDWIPSFISEARSKVGDACMKSGLMKSNMRFEIGYPEALSACGIEKSSVDMIFVNSVLNLAYDAKVALGEMFTALKPGGLLVCETVVASGARNQAVTEQARAIGNSIQSSMFERDFEKLLEDAGFTGIQIVDSNDVSPELGAIPSKPVPVVESDENVDFKAAVFHARKPM